MASDQLKKLRAATEAAFQPPGPKCSVCNFPPDVLETVAQLKSEGKTWTSIAKGLQTIGIETKAARLSVHFGENHVPKG